jgi:APA family basic amino acid/polyamine antiporter
MLMIASRILYALSRDGLFWSQTAAVNARGTPGVAAVATSMVSVALIWSGTFQKLVAVASFFLALDCFAACLALIVLRRREPELDRPFRAWGYPWAPIVVLVTAGAFMIGALIGDTKTELVAVALLIVGLAGRTIASRWRPVLPQAG